MSNIACPICGKNDSCTEDEDFFSGYLRIKCSTFGFYFFIDEDLLKRPDGDPDKENSLDLIAEFLLQHKEHNKERLHFYFNPGYQTKDTDKPNLINIAEKLGSYPDTMTSVADRALINLSILYPHYGDIIVLNYTLRRFIFEHNKNTGPSSGVMTMLTDLGMLKEDPTQVYRITAIGWQKIDELQKKAREIKQGFIAMSFDEKARPIRDAFKQAIKELHYSIYISDEKEHNNQIVPEMFYEIQRSKFAVVDITYPNYGAYYEAGYAQALGKQVIICCRKDVFESPDKKQQPHFDIAQKPVIVWENREELIQKLKRRIEATVT